MKTIIEYSEKLSGYFVHSFRKSQKQDIENRHVMDFVSFREIVWC